MYRIHDNETKPRYSRRGGVSQRTHGSWPDIDDYTMVHSVLCTTLLRFCCWPAASSLVPHFRAIFGTNSILYVHSAHQTPDGPAMTPDIHLR